MKKEIPRDEFVKKRAERQRKIRKRRLTAFFIFFVVTLLCVGVVLSLTVFFPIENLSATGSKIYSSEEILKITGINKGDNLFAVSRSGTEKQLKTNLPYIDSVTFKRQLPDTLEIKVKDAEEFASYKVGKKYFTVSKSGWVMKESTEPHEKIFTVNAKGIKCKVGTQIKFEDAAQKELIDSISTSLTDEKLNYNLIDVTNPVLLTVKVDGRFTVNLGTSNNIVEKIRHLSGMIAEIPKEKQGEINLSMWTSDNTRGTFVAKN